jgi:hypothetical protein
LSKYCLKLLFLAVFVSYLVYNGAIFSTFLLLIIFSIGSLLISTSFNFCAPLLTSLIIFLTGSVLISVLIFFSNSDLLIGLKKLVILDCDSCLISFIIFGSIFLITSSTAFSTT